MKTIELSVGGMSCGHCVSTVESALAVVTGVEKVDVSLPENRARVQAEDQVSEDTLVGAVRQAGYSAELVASRR